MASKGNSTRFKGTKGSPQRKLEFKYRTTNGFTTRLHDDAQGKHIIGHKNYDAGKNRSILNGTLENAQKLISERSGTGVWHGDHKEAVDFGRVIGTWVDPITEEQCQTSRGTIHYSKKGAHIVPAKPRKEYE